MRKATSYLRVAVLFMTILCVFALARSASAAELSGMPDDTVQTNGQIRAVLPVGDRIYIGGAFTEVDGVSRRKLAAIDANTGELTNWRPRTNKQVLALAASPDGRRIYAGGSFTLANGTDRSHLVAIDAATGATDEAWMAQASHTVWSLATLGSSVYVGGTFTSVNGQSRARLAAVDGVTGALNPNWTPTADQNVRTLAPSSDGTRIYAGGQFNNISGQKRDNLAALNPVTGALYPWQPNPCYPVFDLEESGNTVYVAGGGTPNPCNAGGWAEAFDATTGNSRWSLSGDGDFQTVAVLGDTAYYAGHFIEIPWVPHPAHGETWKRFVAVDATTGAIDSQWRPEADLGVWAMAADPLRRRVYAGGAFTQINGQPQQGFAQFSAL